MELEPDIATACSKAAESKARVVLTRDGHPCIAVLPAEDPAWLESLEDRFDANLLAQARLEWEQNGRLASTLDEVIARLGISA
jgi:hypothetical protein